jgi:hypothetical protein
MTNSSSVAGVPQSKSESLTLNRFVSTLSRKPLLAAVLVVALTTALRLTGTVDSDVSWQLWIAHQLNGGAQLYRDIVETNPPLWFWLALPVDRLSSLIHVRSDHVLILIIGCLAALSIAATDRLIGAMSPQRRTLWLVYAALVILAMPWSQAGQREQIALIGTLPYAALIAARRSGQSMPVWIAVLVGLGAAIGFALKHYFLLVPMLLELWLLTGQRKDWRPVRAETLALLTVGSAYAAAILTLNRDFLTLALPLIRLAYGVTGAPHLLDLFQPAVIVGLATLASIGAHLRALRSEPSGVAAALCVAAIAFTIDYFVQAKGWAYHAVPLLGCSAIALATLLASGPKASRLMALTAPALLCLPLAIPVQQAMRETQPGPDMLSAVNGLHAGDSVGFIATDPALGWTVTLQRNFHYPSRYNGFWMMRAVARNEGAGGPDRRLTELGRQVVRETVDDFRCNPPRRIIVARPLPGAAGDSFDILPVFLRDPEFAALLSHYRPIERTSVEVYALASPLSSIPAPTGRCLFRAP